MEHCIALSHASGIAAEAILEKLSESGVAPDSLFLLDHETNAGKRLPYAGGYLSVQDQHAFDLSSCALLLMPEADAELESAALNQGCLLLSHAIEGEAPVLFLTGTETQAEIAFTETRLRLVDAELSCLLPTLIGLDQMQPIAKLNTVLLRSAEFHGKAGVDELASH